MDTRLRRIARLLRLASRLEKVGARQDALMTYPADVLLEKLLPQVTKAEEIMAATISTLRTIDKFLQQKGEGKLGEFITTQASVGLKSAASLRDAIEKISTGAKALRKRTGLPLVIEPRR